MAVKFQDYYETLGVSRSASAQEIHKAYRRLARKYHPDVSKHKNAEDRFKQVNEAYAVLRDPEKRKKYDALGSGWRAGQNFRPPPGWEAWPFEFGVGREPSGDFDLRDDAGATFSDFFETVFGQGLRGFGAGRGARGRRPGARPARGRDREAEIAVSLDDAYGGASRIITLETVEEGRDAVVRRRSKQYEVKIPPGVSEGSRIRLAGQGDPGTSGAAPGDLFLRVHIEPHPVFQVEGQDLLVTVPVAPWEAALGAKVEIPTMEGQVKMTLPPGTRGGQRFRLRGKGLARKDGQRGDLYARVEVVLPRTLTVREKELFEELARTSPFRPREKGRR